MEIYLSLVAQLLLGASGTVISIILGMLFTYLRSRYNLDIEAHHREALHRAAESVVRDFINTRIVKAGTAQAILPTITESDILSMIAKMRESVPDAFSRLDPPIPVLRRILMAKAA